MVFAPGGAPGTRIRSIRIVLAGGIMGVNVVEIEKDFVMRDRIFAHHFIVSFQFGPRPLVHVIGVPRHVNKSHAREF